MSIVPEQPPVAGEVEAGASEAGRERRNWRIPVAVAVAALVVGGVAGALVADDGDEVSRLETASSEQGNRIDELEADLGRTKAELESTSDELEDRTTELEDTSAELGQTQSEREAAEAEALALRKQYDPQIKAEATQEHDAALFAACGEAIEDGSPSYSQLATGHWRNEWGDLLGVDRTAFATQIEECAAPELAKSFRERCGGSADVEAIQKDPDRFIGQCVAVVVDVVQFDQATGPCGFRGVWDTQAHEYSFEYRGDNAILSADSPCPFLDPIGQDDIVRVWATITGGINYDTTIGGTAHAVSFDVGDAELLVDN